MTEEQHINDQLFASLQKQIDELRSQIESMRETEADRVAKKLSFSNADAISQIIPAVNELGRRISYVRESDDLLQRRLNRIFRAHNRHVINTVAPKNQAPGWARSTACKRRTWAKFRGWRL
jgi:signal transduction histidine kinase